MQTDDLIVVCTKDLAYEEVLVSKKGSEYDLLSIGKQSVVIRGENDLATILNESDLREYFLVAPKGEK